METIIEKMKDVLNPKTDYPSKKSNEDPGHSCLLNPCQNLVVANWHFQDFETTIEKAS